VRARVLLVAVTVVALVALVACSRGDGAIGGSGLRYHDTMYWTTSALVLDGALGADLGTGLQFEDTTADLRSITGVDPEVALALRIHGRSAPADETWVLVNAEDHRVYDPWSDDRLAKVLEPRP
jgi:hypothetical protein